MEIILERVLYGRDTKGGIKVWEVTVEKDGKGYLVKYGKLGGKMIENFTNTYPKNIGKSNETTTTKQAIIEATAKAQKQIDKGYVPFLERLTENKNPMLAHDYRKQGHRIDYTHPCGVYIQPKLDGVRCIATFEEGVVKFLSRGGKEYKVPSHIEIELKEMFISNPKLILDGELYIHGDSLQDIVSCVKKHNENTINLEYRIFDIASEEGTWQHRRSILESLHNTFETLKFVGFVEDVEVKSFEDVKRFHDKYVQEGYEGIMIRQGCGTYTYNYRSPYLQKYKEFDDAEFKIVDVKPDKNGMGVPCCILDNGVIFYPTLKGTHKARKDLLDNKEDYIGKLATVSYQGLTEDGIPLFPRTVAIRDYE